MRQSQKTEVNGERNYTRLLVEKNFVCGENPKKEGKKIADNSNGIFALNLIAVEFQ